jgi:hypothetical protein
VAVAENWVWRKTRLTVLFFREISNGNQEKGKEVPPQKVGQKTCKSSQESETSGKAQAGKEKGG